MMKQIFKYTLSDEIGETRDMELIVTVVSKPVVHKDQLESISPQGL